MGLVAALRLAGAVFAVTMLCGTASRAGDDMMVYKCERGRPQYCLKYGEGHCRKTNSLPNNAEACAQWTEACVECQTAIANCFERSAEPVLQGSAECTACQAEMHSCMEAIDKQYWPNR